MHGVAKVRVGDREFLLARNESTYIPMIRCTGWRIRAMTDLQLIEVQCGDYFGEDDIVRLEDKYGARRLRRRVRRVCVPVRAA